MKDIEQRTRQGATEVTAIPYCRCGHYAKYHERADRPSRQPCYLCDCQAIRPRRVEPAA